MEDQEKPDPKTESETKAADGSSDSAGTETTEPEKPAKPKKASPGGASRRQRLQAWYLSHKKLSIPFSVLAILVVLAAVPFSRYAVAGIFLSHDVQVQVLDSKSGKPVSDAKVQAGSGTVGYTSGTGYATLHDVKAGPTTITASKKYYDDAKLRVTVGILKSKKAVSLPLEATGRQVKVKVINAISQKPLAEVEISVSDIKAKTDQAGEAVVVLPVGTKSAEASLSLKDYNAAKVTLQVSETEIKQNDYKLTPAGQVYFLTNRNGTVDVMKSNLDGSEPKVVLAGTGREDEHNTVLIASPSWRYLALLARRDDKPKLYVINTADDKLTTADEGAANFSISGWLGNNLIYSLTRTDLSAWQTGASKLKSYNADTGKITLLDQTTGSGDATANIYEYYGLVFLSGDTVVYAKAWTSQGFGADFSGKQDKIAVISAIGKDSKTVFSVDTATKSLDYTVHAPNAIYIAEYSKASQQVKYYDYAIGSQPQATELTNEQYYQDYYAYYASPNGKRVAWSDTKDGQPVALLGEPTSSDGKVVKGTEGYSEFGWYTDSYLLISKESSELYITTDQGGPPLRITNYHSLSAYGVLFYGYY
jgi:hypothetical protein